MNIESSCDAAHEKPAVKQNPNGSAFNNRYSPPKPETRDPTQRCRLVQTSPGWRRQRWHIVSCVLVRPDRHVAWRSMRYTPDNARQLPAVVEQALGLTRPPDVTG